MSAEGRMATIADLALMCKSVKVCKNCPLTTAKKCNFEEMTEAELKDANHAILCWLESYTRRNTNYSKLIKVFPQAVGKDRISVICPRKVDIFADCDGGGPANIRCDECKREYWTREIKEES